MEATVRLPEALADCLVRLATEEGVTVDGFVGILVSEHLERRQSSPGRSVSPRKDVQFPMIPKKETGAIAPITGTDLDEIFTRDYLAA